MMPMTLDGAAESIETSNLLTRSVEKSKVENSTLTGPLLVSKVMVTLLKLMSGAEPEMETPRQPLTLLRVLVSLVKTFETTTVMTTAPPMPTLVQCEVEGPTLMSCILKLE